MSEWSKSLRFDTQKGRADVAKLQFSRDAPKSKMASEIAVREIKMLKFIYNVELGIDLYVFLAVESENEVQNFIL